MNKRLRKKKHIGEFKEFGFSIKVKFKEKLFHENNHDNLDKFIDIVDQYSFETGGGFKDDIYDGVISVINYKVNINEQKPKFLNALNSEPNIVDVEVSDNIDVWYGPFDE